MNNKTYDVIIVGAGPAGLMAAYSALDSNKSVLIIEKNEIVGRKLSLTGGGRCNITNNKEIPGLVDEIHNGVFLYGCLNSFGPKDIKYFFEKRGLKIIEEDGGRMFPITGKSSDVIKIILEELNSFNNFDIKHNHEVLDIKYKNNKITHVITNKGEYACDNLILATGGKSYEKTGSDGFGLKLAEKLGHTISKTYPAVTPIVCDNDFILTKSLMGISFKNIKIAINNYSETGYDLIITHYGISGPAVFRISDKAYKEIIANKQLTIKVDLIPGIREDVIVADYKKHISDKNKIEILQFLKKYIPDRVAQLILKKQGVTIDKSVNEISKSQIHTIIKAIKSFEFNAIDTKGFDHSFVTGGGVSIKEVNSKTMNSKIIDNLYFAGEILDLHANTGGYNITLSFSTGYTAGKLVR